MGSKRNVRKLIAPFLILYLMFQPVFSYAGTDDAEPEETESFDQPITPSEYDLSGIWSGTYIDSDAFSFVPRNISFHITNCNIQSGDFEGSAEIDHGDGGEFYFTGVVNYNTMDFSLSGVEWVENPADSPLYTFTGIVSDDYARISGMVNSDMYSIFSVERISEENESVQNEENDTDMENSTETEGSAESAESDETETSQEDWILQQLEILQSERDELKNENEILKNILEENEIEYD